MSDDSKLRITIKEFLTIHIFRTVHHCLIYSNCWQLQQKLSALCQKTKSIDGEQKLLVYNRFNPGQTSENSISGE